jgi:hypothetical protein
MRWCKTHRQEFTVSRETCMGYGEQVLLSGSGCDVVTMIEVDGPVYQADIEALVRWMFLQAEGIDPEMAYNDDKPYGDEEWAIDREHAWKWHGDDARAVLAEVGEEQQ